jgi:hypothetical protein
MSTRPIVAPVTGHQPQRAGKKKPEHFAMKCGAAIAGAAAAIRKRKNGGGDPPARLTPTEGDRRAETP